MTDSIPQPPTPPQPGGGALADNIVHFARALRAAGMPVGPAAIIDAIHAVETAGIANRDDFYWTLHAIFVNKRDQRPIFDEAFRVFWRSRGLVEKMLAILSPVAPPRGEPEKPKAAQARVANALQQETLREAKETKPEIEIDARFTVSGAEVLQTKDFAQMTAVEIAEAKTALKRLILPVDTVRQRRLVAASKHRHIDARRSMRASLRAGGDIIALRYRKPAEIHPPIVALCDISGSMSQYSRIFLHFLHALTENRRKVHTFLFGTRLSNVTRQLTMKDPDEALDAVTDQVEDWSGGTRIATALHAFNRKWSRRVMHGGPIVLLITDGLERDTHEDLGPEMDRLHRSCRKLIWLNPLLRFDRFEARARGIRAMLPHVDEFRPVHSLDAVSDLCKALAGDTGQTTDPRDWLRKVS
ncbi:VWA domain-containing protein [Breoghania sp.]|uniref:vWA domain-containing protein n=1 Tax=Breoghania sp. TaxID=2065378 RepID=UPI002AA85B5F|nr:VWA domain-containing protein [Breoghania sp.]